MCGVARTACGKARALVRNRRLVLLLSLLIVVIAANVVVRVIDWAAPEEPDYTCIEPGLFMGAAVNKPPPGTEAVLNLCADRDPYECRIHAGEPIHDGPPAPSVQWLRERVEFIRDQRESGRTTFVHCWAGVSRSGLVVAAYLMEKNGWTRDEALRYVRSKRPCVRPNKWFMELLSEWEDTLAAESGNQQPTCLSHWGSTWCDG